MNEKIMLKRDSVPKANTLKGMVLKVGHANLV